MFDRGCQGMGRMPLMHGGLIGAAEGWLRQRRQVGSQVDTLRRSLSGSVPHRSSVGQHGPWVSLSCPSGPIPVAKPLTPSPFSLYPGLTQGRARLGHTWLAGADYTSASASG